MIGRQHQRAPRQVIRRRHQHPVRRGQLARHHALGQLKTTADSGIEALADQVDLAVIEVPVRIDIRKAPHKFAQQRHHIPIAEHRPHTDLECTHGPPFGTGQVGDRILDGGEAAADFLQEHLAGFGQRQAPSAALKQPHTEARLQLGDAFTHRCGSEAQVPCSLGKAATLGAAHKAFDTAKAFHIAPL